MDLPLEQTWLVLVELLTDLKKKEKMIPLEINDDLKILKSLINFYKVDPTETERMNELERINSIITNVQQSLLDISEDLGEEYNKKWLKKLQKATIGDKIYENKEIKSNFVINTPPGFSFSRITFDKPISEDRIQEISEYHNLITEFEGDEVLLIFSLSLDNMKKGIKELGSFFNES